MGQCYIPEGSQCHQCGTEQKGKILSKLCNKERGWSVAQWYIQHNTSGSGIDPSQTAIAFYFIFFIIR